VLVRFVGMFSPVKYENVPFDSLSRDKIRVLGHISRSVDLPGVVDPFGNGDISSIAFVTTQFCLCSVCRRRVSMNPPHLLFLGHSLFDQVRLQLCPSSAAEWWRFGGSPALVPRCACQVGDGAWCRGDPDGLKSVELNSSIGKARSHSLLVPIWEPLTRQTRPLESMSDDDIIKVRRVLLPILTRRNTQMYESKSFYPIRTLRTISCTPVIIKYTTRSVSGRLGSHTQTTNFVYELVVLLNRFILLFCPTR